LFFNVVYKKYILIKNKKETINENNTLHILKHYTNDQIV